METMVTDDSEVTMDAEMEIGETENETVEPSLQKRRNTWPGSLQRPEAEEGATSKMAAIGADEEMSPPTARKPSTRRNAWGNMSYAEMITAAIESAPEKRMTLAQIYDWIVKNVPYFQDKGDNSSSASWKNSVRHNLSLHSQFMKLQNEGTSKSSWWVVKPDAAMQRRRARTMESGTFDRRRGKGRLKAPGANPASTIDDISQPGSRCRSNSFASSRGRLSPIQSEAEPGIEWNQDEQVSGVTSTQFIVSGSQQQHLVTEATTHFPVSTATPWQNFTMTLNDPTPLVATSTPLVATASGQTAMLFVDQGVQVSTAKLPESRVTISQAPVIVLLAAAQATLPQYLPSTSVGGVAVASPSTQPLNNISCVTFGRLEAISDANITQQQILPVSIAQQQVHLVSIAQQQVLPASSVATVIPPKDPEPPVQTSNAGTPLKTKSVSESYLQVLRFLTSKNVRAYMKTHPDFKEKLCKFLLAKKAKMIQEMSGQQPQQQQRRILPLLMQEDQPGERSLRIEEHRSDKTPLEIPRVAESQRGGSGAPDRSRLEEILSSISLTCESSSNQPLPQSSTMQDVRTRFDRSTLEEILNSITLTGKPASGQPFLQASAMQQNRSNLDNALPMQLGGLDIDIDQDITQDLEPDFLLDFNLDNLTGDLNCDDDFLNQF